MKVTINSILIIATVLAITTTHPATATLLQSTARAQDVCFFPDGVAGRCEPLALCTDSSDGVMRRNNTILRCAADSNVIHVCCRRPAAIAEKMCRVWGRYWRERSSEADAPCIEEFPLIHGGVDAILGEFPNMASLGHRTASNEIKWECGASLITPLFALTAAHCIARPGLKLVVGLGEHNLRNPVNTELRSMDFGFPEGLAGHEQIAASFRVTVPTEQYIDVESYSAYPEYQKIYHDIALLRLKTPAVMTSRVLPGCLPYTTTQQQQQFVATGWGAVEFGGDFESSLRKVAVKYVAPVTCMMRFKELNPFLVIPLGITSDMFCAGASGKDTCRGDSGGPLMDEPKQSCLPRTVSGVVSFGPPCREIGAYTRVSSYLEWITATVAPEAVHDADGSQR